MKMDVMKKIGEMKLKSNLVPCADCRKDLFLQWMGEQLIDIRNPEFNYTIDDCIQEFSEGYLDDHQNDKGENICSECSENYYSCDSCGDIHKYNWSGVIKST